MARWFEVLASYDFVIMHSRNHGNADALSKRPCVSHQCSHCEGVEKNHETRESFLSQNTSHDVKCENNECAEQVIVQSHDTANDVVQTSAHTYDTTIQEGRQLQENICATSSTSQNDLDVPLVSMSVDRRADLVLKYIRRESFLSQNTSHDVKCENNECAEQVIVQSQDTANDVVQTSAHTYDTTIQEGRQLQENICATSSTSQNDLDVPLVSMSVDRRADLVLKYIRRESFLSQNTSHDVKCENNECAEQVIVQSQDTANDVVQTSAHTYDTTIQEGRQLQENICATSSTSQNDLDVPLVSMSVDRRADLVLKYIIATKERNLKPKWPSQRKSSFTGIDGIHWR